MKAFGLSILGIVIIVAATVLMIDATLAGKVDYADREAVHWDQVAVDAGEKKVDAENATASAEQMVALAKKANMSDELTAVWETVLTKAKDSEASAARWATRSSNIATRTRADAADERQKAITFYDKNCSLRMFYLEVGCKYSFDKVVLIPVGK